jgi:RNA recognition motif-containing protein
MTAAVPVSSTTTATDATTTTSTRVCIKNLPPSFDEGNSNDSCFKNRNCRFGLPIRKRYCVVRRHGTSRKIAFVGLTTPEQAAHVVHYFHKSFCLTSRLIVELAISKQATDKPRPWSKLSKTTAAAATATAVTARTTTSRHESKSQSHLDNNDNTTML